MTLIEEKVMSCKVGIIESYNRRKTVNKFIVSEQTDETDSLFLNIGLRISTENTWFSSPSHYPFFDNFGDSIAIGEEKYLVEKIIAKLEPDEIKIDALSYELLKGKFSPYFSVSSVLLVPLKILYMRILQEMNKWPILYDYTINSFVLNFDGLKVPVYSIHEDIIDSHLLIFRKEIGKWHYKTYPNPKYPEKKETILVEIKETGQSKVEILAMSSIKLEIEDMTLDALSLNLGNAT